MVPAAVVCRPVGSRAGACTGSPAGRLWPRPGSLALGRCRSCPSNLNEELLEALRDDLHAAERERDALAARTGALRIDEVQLARWVADARRTLYLWDVRTPDEYEAGHLPGFGSAPGGQLVQETDVCAAVRGARIAPPAPRKLIERICRR